MAASDELLPRSVAEKVSEGLGASLAAAPSKKDQEVPGPTWFKTWLQSGRRGATTSALAVPGDFADTPVCSAATVGGVNIIAAVEFVVARAPVERVVARCAE